MVITKDHYEALKKELDWTPLSGACANFTTHRICPAGIHEMRSRITLFYVLFLVLFFVVGIVLLWFTTFGDPVYRNGAAPFRGENIWGDLLCYFLGIAFACFSGVTLFLDKKVVLDKLSNSIFMGEKSITSERIDWPLDEVFAIQLLGKHCKDSDGDGYLGFELNAVFNNKQRINLMTHGGQSAITKDAARVARFLGKPIFTSTMLLV